MNKDTQTTPDHSSNKILKYPPKMTNSTSADATFGGAWCSKITKQKDCHSTAPADSQINDPLKHLIYKDFIFSILKTVHIYNILDKVNGFCLNILTKTYIKNIIIIIFL